MANVLSRAEADALLTSLHTIAPVAKLASDSVQPAVSLASRDLVSNELLAILRQHHEIFCKSCEETLTGVANAAVNLQLREIQTQRPSQIDDDVELAPFEVSRHSNELNSEIGIRIDRRLVADLINRTLGGPSNQFESSERRLTDIETRILERIVGSIVADYDRTWSRITQIPANQNSVTALSAESNEQVTSSLELQIHDEIGTLEIVALSGVLIERSKRCVVSSEGDVAPVTGRGETETSKSVVSVELEPTRLTPQEIRDLQVGDVIVTDTSLKNGLRVIRDGTLQLHATPGTLQGRKAIQISATND